MRNIKVYKNAQGEQQLIIQRLFHKKSNDNASKKTLVIVSVGYHVNVYENGRIKKHDPFFSLPKKEAKAAMEGIEGEVEVITFYFTFSSSGLAEPGKLLMEHINREYKEHDIYDIYGVLHSKSAVCFARHSHLLKNVAKQKDEVLLVSPPLKGVNSTQYIKERLPSFLCPIYDLIIIDHNTNHDIEKGSRYLTNATYKGLKKFNTTLIQSSLYPPNDKKLNMINTMLRYFDQLVGTKGDILVPFSSQDREDIRPEFKSIVYTSHMGSLIEGLKIKKDYDKKNRKQPNVF